MSPFLYLDINLTLCQILDELIIAGELQESSKKSVLRVVCYMIGLRREAGINAIHR